MVKRGEDTWFFVTADYAFGQALERDAANVVKENGGRVLGDVRHPLNSSDFSSFLLQAQASKAKVIGLANAGGDTTKALKQAAEFGIMQGGQKIIALLMEIADVHALGLTAAQGLIVTDGSYWDANEETRRFSEKFMGRVGHMPTMIQAGLYSATMHDLKAIEAIGTDEASKVVAQMRAVPINDFFAKGGKIRIDGRMVHDMNLYEVKTPEQSKGEMGPLQADRDGARRRSVPCPGQGWLPAGEDKLAAKRRSAGQSRRLARPHRTTGSARHHLRHRRR
jgi:branched-chain amino acid transport system substrate-binding protein